MAVFGWRKPSEAQLAFRRTESLLREHYVVKRISESDWTFAPPGADDELLLTMWAYRDGDRERPQKQPPFDGLIWDFGWYVERGKLSEAQIAMVRAAAGRGSVDAESSRVFKAAHLFFYDRLVTPMDYEEDEAAKFIMECVAATQRMHKAMAH